MKVRGIGGWVPPVCLLGPEDVAGPQGLGPRSGLTVACAP